MKTAPFYKNAIILREFLRDCKQIMFIVWKSRDSCIIMLAVFVILLNTLYSRIVAKYGQYRSLVPQVPVLNTSGYKQVKLYIIGSTTPAVACAVSASFTQWTLEHALSYSIQKYFRESENPCG